MPFPRCCGCELLYFLDLLSYVKLEEMFGRMVRPPNLSHFFLPLNLSHLLLLLFSFLTFLHFLISHSNPTHILFLYFHYFTFYYYFHLFIYFLFSFIFLFFFIFLGKLWFQAINIKIIAYSNPRFANFKFTMLIPKIFWVSCTLG